MAYDIKGSSGSYEFGSTYFTIKVDWSDWYDIALNASIVKIDAVWLKSNSVWTGTWHPDCCISINDEQVVAMSMYATATHYAGLTAVGVYARINGYREGQANTWQSSPIPHNADGSKSINIKFYGNNVGTVSVYRNSSSGTQYVVTSNTKSITLTNIPRSAQLVSAPNFNDEENPTITYSNPAGTTATKVEACISLDGSSADVPYRDIPITGTSYTFELTEDERNALRRATVGSTMRTVKFYVRTTLGGATYVSSLTKTFSVINAEPEMSVFMLDTNSATTALTGDSLVYVVKGYSNMSYEINAMPKKEAIVEIFNAQCGTQKKTTSSGVFEKAESSNFIFSVTDSRGLTTSNERTLNLINYFKPTCSATCKLTLDTETTLKASMTVNGSFFNGSFGAVKNSLEIFIKHSAADDWISLQNDIGFDYYTDGDTYSMSFNITELDYQKPFTYQIKVVDKLENAFSAEETLSFLPVFDWGKNDFNFNVPVTIQGNLLNDFVVETGTDAMGSNGTWYWAKWASGRAECYGQRNYGNMGVSTALGSLYKSSEFTQSLPSGLFADAPEYVDITFEGSGSSTAAFIASADMSSASDTKSFFVVSPTSGTVSQARIGFNVIGRWK